MPDFREGQTATNPKTGQKIVYQGGLWVAAGGAGQDLSGSLKPIEQKRLDEVRESGTNALSVLDDLTRFQNVNAKTRSGGTGGTFPWVDIRESFDPGVQQLKEISARMAPAQRPVGSGSTSDKDLALYLQAGPSMSKSRKANDIVVERGRREAVTRQQRADFYEQYAREKGTINGAEQAFRAMIGRGSTENPYDIKSAGDRSQLPRGAYYQSPEGVRRNDNGPAGNPVITPTPRPVDKFRGNPAAPRAAVKVNSPEEAAKLPPGTKFIGHDGIERTRQ